MDVSKNRRKTPKMDGLFHGNPYEQMDDLGAKPSRLQVVQEEINLRTFPHGNVGPAPTPHSKCWG